MTLELPGIVGPVRERMLPVPARDVFDRRDAGCTCKCITAIIHDSAPLRDETFAMSPRLSRNTGTPEFRTGEDVSVLGRKPSVWRFEADAEHCRCRSFPARATLGSHGVVQRREERKMVIKGRKKTKGTKSYRRSSHRGDCDNHT
jgi:hypothetical protein